jgi:hypothetical protein
MPIRNPKRAPRIVRSEPRPQRRSRYPPSRGGSANSRPMVVTRVAQRTPRETTESGSGRLKVTNPFADGRRSAAVVWEISDDPRPPRTTSYTPTGRVVNNLPWRFEKFFTMSTLAPEMPGNGRVSGREDFVGDPGGPGHSERARTAARRPVGPVVPLHPPAIVRGRTRWRVLSLTSVSTSVIPYEAESSATKQTDIAPVRGLYDKPLRSEPERDRKAASDRVNGGRPPFSFLGRACGGVVPRRPLGGPARDPSPAGTEPPGSDHSRRNFLRSLSRPRGPNRPASLAGGDGVAPHDRRLAQGLQ